MTLIQNLIFALRMLKNSPAFTAAAVLTLALGIGANTAIFTVANAVLLRPLPYSDPDRLVVLSSTLVEDQSQTRGFSWGQYQLLRDHNSSFFRMSALTSDVFNVTSGGFEPEQVSAARVSGDFFALLGVRPRFGRGFLPEEDRAGGPAVAVISNSLWVRRFAGQPAVLGHTLTLDSRDYKVVGILPPDFQFPLLGPKVEVWVPRVFELNFLRPAQIAAGAGYLNAIARLNPGVTQSQAAAEMRVLNRQYQKDNSQKPDADPKRTVGTVLLRDVLVANLRVALFLLLGAVGFVLLIACANVANLLMSRALGRRKEIAIRAALGADRSTIIRQLLTESLALSAISGAAGLLLAWWGTHALAAVTSSVTFANLPRSGDFGIDARVLLFTLAISIATGLLFGLIPAIQISRTDVNSVLREEGRSTTGSRRRNLAVNTLVVAQVALSLMLLIGSGLLLRSFLQLQQTDPGCDLSHVLTMSLTRPSAKYSTPEQLVTLHDRLLAEVAAVPGVESAAVSVAVPLNPFRFTPCNKEGDQALPLSQRPIVAINQISPEYLKVMGIPLIRGRAFTAHDDANGAKIMLVNRELARRFWPNQDAIGQKIYIGLRAFPNEVVGVVADVKNVGLTVDTMPEIYVPMAQLPSTALALSVRTSGDPHQPTQAVRQAVSRVDRDQPVTAVQTMEELEDSLNARPRLTMLLLAAFAVTAFLLAIIGIYGVISHSVAQRTHELGIRIALGAQTRDILYLVLSQGLALSFIGIALGLAGALALTRVMSSLLYRVQANDPRTFLFSALAFTAVALLASYLPARRATQMHRL
jgi:putative ABC transport system permease protein